MSDLIETRTLYTDDRLEIVGKMHVDQDADPTDRDFETEEHKADYVERYTRDDWSFIGLAVTVLLDGSLIGVDSLWGVEHGTVAEGIEANAWDLTPAEYSAVRIGGVETPAITMAAPLNGVVNGAISDAVQWAMRNEPGTAAWEALRKAQVWADPNNPENRATRGGKKAAP